MGTKIYDAKIVTNGSGFSVDPQRLDITKEKILEYIKTHPMPNDPEYSLDDLIFDLTEGGHIYLLPFKIKEETMRYVEKLIDDLKNGRNYDIWKL